MADLARAPYIAPLLRRSYPVSRFVGYRHNLTQLGPLARQEFDNPRDAIKARLWAVLRLFFGTVLSLVLLALLARTNTFRAYNTPVVIGSFATEVALQYLQPTSPFSQPRVALFANTTAAVIGIAFSKAFLQSDSFSYGNPWGIAWIAAPLVTAITLSFLTMVGTPFPPGGATALLAMTVSEIKNMSWSFAPVILIDTIIVTLVACFVGNIGDSVFPTYWISPSIWANREHGTGRLIPGKPFIAVEGAVMQGIPHRAFGFGKAERDHPQPVLDTVRHTAHGEDNNDARENVTKQREAAEKARHGLIDDDGLPTHEQEAHRQQEARRAEHIVNVDQPGMPHAANNEHHGRPSESSEATLAQDRSSSHERKA